MSDEFIPFNQSTPKPGGWQRKNSNNSRYYNQNGSRQQFSKSWSNNSHHSQRNNSYGSDSFNNSRQSFSYAYDVNAYLHPAMLQDPWEQLRKNQPK